MRLRLTMVLRSSLAVVLATLTIGACAHRGGEPHGLPDAELDPVAVPMPDSPPLAIATAEAGCAEGPHVIACRELNPEEPIHHMAMAVSGPAIGIGWTTAGSPWLSSSVHGPGRFAVLDSQLRAVRQVTLPGEVVHDIAVAAHGPGFIVAQGDGTQTMVQRVDPQPRADEPLVQLDGGWAPHLAVGPHGEVLVVRVGAVEGKSVVRAALLTSTAEPPRFDVVLAPMPTEPRFGSAIAVDDGFLVSMRVSGGIEVVRVEKDGRVSARHQQMGGQTEYPKLAPCGRGAAMVWADFFARGKMRWSSLDRHGAARGEAITLGGVPHYFDPSPLTCDGEDSIVLLNGYTGGTGVASRLDLLRVDDRGRFGLPVPATSGTMRAYDSAIDRLGDDLVVAWLVLDGSIYVERLELPGAPEQRAR